MHFKKTKETCNDFLRHLICFLEKCKGVCYALQLLLFYFNSWTCTLSRTAFFCKSNLIHVRDWQLQTEAMCRSHSLVPVVQRAGGSGSEQREILLAGNGGACESLGWIPIPAGHYLIITGWKGGLSARRKRSWGIRLLDETERGQKAIEPVRFFALFS